MARARVIRVRQFALAGSAERLTTDSFDGAESFAVKSHDANAGKVYLGSDNTVSSTTGFELSPGASVGIDASDPSAIWVIGTAAERVSVLAAYKE